MSGHINKNDVLLVNEALETAQNHPNWPVRMDAKEALVRILEAAKREGQDEVLGYLDEQDPGLDDGWCHAYSRWFRERRGDGK